MEAEGKVEPLLQRLAGVSGMGPGQRRLVLILPQLGDFDSLEYAQQLVPVLPRLEAAGIALLAIGLGEAAGAQRFCAFTGFPADRLQVESEPWLHRALGLSPGLQAPGGPWPSLLLMCAGIASPGTLAEVLRGYSGDRSAAQRLAAEDTVLVPPLPPIRGSLLALAGGEGFLRPFELALLRLGNMAEVLGRWRTYVPHHRHLTQRGGTFLLETDDTLLYSHRDPGLLGYSATMARPLSFLDPFLESPVSPSTPTLSPSPRLESP
ncbi:AhpC/TSA family protein [Cyanobium sp. LEGE 06113]|uniref:AhpC/TSA family protein n=1 Tax=Cyanobium sp. LEGE 06113 TaxID=1297573 RepID=UPI0018802F08|nr:AhpC/TSA family protein [Cyanobium sp. LEGE 06113]MBE9154996.1 AhpC/TSA family protein [Cyanobium sp. LEGE 06113]